MIFGKVDKYVLKEFCKMFIYIVLCTTILVFFVNFLEFYGEVEKLKIKIFDAIKIVLLRTPPVIESALYFIVLLSNSFTLTKLSLTSELTAILANKKSLVDIIIVQSVFIFIFGLVYVSLFNPYISKMLEISNNIEKKYTNKEKNNYMITKNGIWFKQPNMENDVEVGEIIFKANELYLENLEFKDTTVIFNLSNGAFQKKIKANSMKYMGDKFILENCQVIKKDVEYVDQIIIPTKLTENFLRQYIKNQYKDIDMMSFNELVKLIIEFKKSGLDTTKFVVKLYVMLLIPFMYVVMIILSYAFLSVNARRQDYILNIFKTIVGGFIVFTLQNVLTNLGSSGLIAEFASTVIPFVLMFFTAIIIVIKKIKLCNF